MEYIKIIVSDNPEDKKVVSGRKMWYPYQSGLTVQGLLEGIMKQSDMEIYEMLLAVLKDWKNYLIIVDGKSIMHQEGLQTKINNGSDVVVFTQFSAGG